MSVTHRAPSPQLSDGTSFTVEPMLESDWEAVCAIFVEGIATGNATFESAPPTWQQWNAKQLTHCRYVARAADGVIGWIAISASSNRYVYRGVAEVSVYVSERARGQGVGSALLETLIAVSEAAGIWTLQAGIFPENAASLALHKSMGFREVGIRERPGKLGSIWRDVVMLERRSSVVGVD